MLVYTLKRLGLMVPTLLGILLLNFVIVQAAPGGPVERAIATLKGHNTEATARMGGAGATDAAGGAQQSALQAQTKTVDSGYRGAQGIDPEIVEELKRLYGFDQPAHMRFFTMLSNYVRGDFGTSYFRDADVLDLILEKMPVSLSLGIWSTLLVYLIAVPLGVRKALHEGSRFDTLSTLLLVIGYAVPSFLLAMLLIQVFASGNMLAWFPLRGLTSPDFDSYSATGKILDYLWHITLPTIALVISGLAGLVMLTKNSLLDEIHKQYVLVARAKGLSESQTLWRHVFRNAMLLVIAGFPAALLGMLFTSSLLIEVMFSLDGLGLLGFESAINRDYPVMFGTLFLFTLLGLILKLVGDLMYCWVDPRIDFESR